MSDTSANDSRAKLLSLLKNVSIDGMELSEYDSWESRIASILAGLSDEDIAGMTSRLSASLGHTDATIELFAREHGLTPAEQLLLESISEGLSVPEHADRQNIAVNTARVHMQRVLEKTGARRQTDLLRLLYRR